MLWGERKKDYFAVCINQRKKQTFFWSVSKIDLVKGWDTTTDKHNLFLPLPPIALSLSLILFLSFLNFRANLKKIFFYTYKGNTYIIFACLLIRYFDSFVRFDLLKHLTDYVQYLMTSFIIRSNFHSFSFVLSFKWCLLDFLLNLTDIFWFTLPIISFILIFIYLCKGNHHFKANNKKKISAVCGSQW